ncbi:MAG TPA: hypothetical protein VNU96_12105 [Burkholderiales bacterium]|jgi:hypothetical protein|nr:hypothetical protein [Burkholderiales bacterium]
MNRITETELLEVARVSFDLASEPRETLAQSLAASARRLSYFLTLWGAVAIAYVVARALLA